MGRRYRLYLAVLAATAATLLLSVGLTNLLIDPYGVWQILLIPGINLDKPAEIDNEMIFKAEEIIRRRPQNVFLGSSRVDLGLDPQHLASQDIGSFYNLALVGGNIHVIRRYYEHYLANASHPEQVVLGLDFFAFSANLAPPPTFADQRLGRRSISLRDANLTLLSRDALSESLRTILSNLHHPEPPDFRSDGMLADRHMRALAETKGMVDRFETSLTAYLNEPGRYADYVLSDAAFDELREIIRLSRDRGVDLHLFVPPEHAALLEVLAARGLFSTFLAWKRRLAELSGYWDFSGYNAITTEPIARSMRFYWDASHFRAGVGNWMLDRMFGIASSGPSEPFGLYVTQGNVQRWTEQTARQHAEWAIEHPQLVRRIAGQMRPASRFSGPIPASPAANDGCCAEFAFQSWSSVAQRPSQ